MQLTGSVLKDKIRGCWVGKNIGGVLGAPYENIRKINEVDFYTQDLSAGPPANDDLDLQLIWLNAIERFGRSVNASILGEYWLSYVLPNWVEYGTCKANLRAGLMPPLSGAADNTYRNSCGCYIRSEIWACLAPGNPDLAVEYAYEDAIVDHAEEGVYAEVFCAALESAAFSESDKRTLIEIGLSYVPEECALAQAVRCALASYDAGIDIFEARKRIHHTAPGTIGIEGWKLSEVPLEGNEGMEPGTPGFDAPENVAFSIAGWLYGEDDFGKSLCLTNALGEDADCTCATLGAIMGIISGEKGIPRKWKEPLNDKIATMCINKTNGKLWLPDTTEELTDRILRLLPGFLGPDCCDIFAEGGMSVSCREGMDLYYSRKTEYLPGINACGRDIRPDSGARIRMSPYVLKYDFPLFTVYLDLDGSCRYSPGRKREIRVRVYNSSLIK